MNIFDNSRNRGNFGRVRPFTQPRAQMHPLFIGVSLKPMRSETSYDLAIRFDKSCVHTIQRGSGHHSQCPDRTLSQLLSQFV